MIKKLSICIYVRNILTMEINKGFFQKIYAPLKEFLLKIWAWFKENLFKKCLEEKECKEFLGEACNNILESSPFKPDPKRHNLTNTLNDIIKQVEEALQGKRSALFTEEAFPVVKKNIEKYICLLISESIYVSKLVGGEIVKKDDVERAVNFLAASKRQYKTMATIGGLLAGGAISGIVTMIITQNPSAFIWIALAVSLATGATLIFRG